MMRKVIIVIYSYWSRVRSIFLPVKLFEGIPHNGEKPFTLAYIGWDKKIMHYFLKSIFERNDRQKGARYIPAWKIEKYANILSGISDLALLELNTRITRKRSRDIFGFLIPRWLKMYIDVDRTYEILKAKRNPVHRKVRKFNFGVEVSTLEEDFVYYYENMYRPYIGDRHKGSAVIAPYKKMFGNPDMDSAMIFFVTYEGKRIAGNYVQIFGGVPYMNSIGILNGSTEYLKMGAIGACYFFVTEYCKDKHIPRVNIGGTSPLLRDGLTRFKISLGGILSEPELQDSIRLKLLLLKYSHGLSAYLMNSGFVHIEGDEIHCAIFKNRQTEETDPEFEKHLQHARSMGADDVEVINITP